MPSLRPPKIIICYGADLDRCLSNNAQNSFNLAGSSY
jgi:hypothetical protein